MTLEQPVRLHKLLARMGVASLRASERLIREGRVTVNGEVVRTPGASALPTDVIAVDGRIVTPQAHREYVMLNKPKGVLSTARDERGRRTVLDLVESGQRLYPVGRLDRDSEGMMLLTNDGELAHRLTHPRYGVHKRYTVEVRGDLSEERLRELRQGVRLEDGPSRPLEVRVLERSEQSATLSVTMGEGRKRQVRRTLEALGLEVTRLVRVALGPLELGDLPPGAHRPLSEDEVGRLRRAAGLEPEGDST